MGYGGDGADHFGYRYWGGNWFRYGGRCRIGGKIADEEPEFGGHIYFGFGEGDDLIVGETSDYGGGSAFGLIDDKIGIGISIEMTTLIVNHYG